MAVLASCSQRVAANRLLELEILHPLIDTAIKKLEIGSNLMDEYFEVKHSIFWNSANAALKRQTQAKLDVLAFDAYDRFISATKDCNQYIELCGHSHFTEVQLILWKDAIRCLQSAERDFQREHKSQIYYKQLTLKL